MRHSCTYIHIYTYIYIYISRSIGLQYIVFYTSTLHVLRTTECHIHGVRVSSFRSHTVYALAYIHICTKIYRITIHSILHVYSARPAYDRVSHPWRSSFHFKASYFICTCLSRHIFRNICSYRQQCASTLFHWAL